jgi:hypothetical protein
MCSCAPDVAPACCVQVCRVCVCDLLLSGRFFFFYFKKTSPRNIDHKFTEGSPSSFFPELFFFTSSVYTYTERKREKFIDNQQVTESR